MAKFLQPQVRRNSSINKISFSPYLTASYFRSSTYNRLYVCSKAFATKKVSLQLFWLGVILYGRYDVSGYPFDPIHRLDETRTSCFIKPEEGIERISRNVVSFLQFFAVSQSRSATTYNRLFQSAVGPLSLEDLSKCRSHRLCVPVKHLNIIFVMETPANRNSNRRKPPCGHPYNKVKTYRGHPVVFEFKTKAEFFKVNVKTEKQPQ
jgi:hypothetical protein